jgi:hypothetical protein
MMRIRVTFPLDVRPFAFYESRGGRLVEEERAQWFTRVSYDRVRQLTMSFSFSRFVE